MLCVEYSTSEKKQESTTGLYFSSSFPNFCRRLSTEWFSETAKFSMTRQSISLHAIFLTRQQNAFKCFVTFVSHVLCYREL